MDRLAAMSLLLEVVESGSFSAAGRRVGMPLATVSRHIAALEAGLHTRLLNRSTRRLSLTDAGADYVDACRRILDEVGEAERAAAGEYRMPRGSLVVTAPIVFGRLHVLPALTAFLERFVDVSVRLVLADALVHLLEERIDLAVRIGDLPSSGLVATQLGAVRRVVCASPGYLDRRGVPTTPEMLQRHDCIAFDGLTVSGTWPFGAGRSSHAAPIRSRLWVSTAEAAIDAAVAGLGVTRVLSYQVKQAVQHGNLITVLDAFEPPPWPVHLVHSGQSRLPLKLRSCIDFLVPRLRECLAA
jgi:DNA-binding transcriptional LysR family regulator